VDDDVAVFAADDADFEHVAGAVGSDEHRQAVVEVEGVDRVAGGVEHVIIRELLVELVAPGRWWQ
jgi:hypothetical protein